MVRHLVNGLHTEIEFYIDHTMCYGVFMYDVGTLYTYEAMKSYMLQFFSLIFWKCSLVSESCKTTTCIKDVERD